jgi:hypothetical protein
MKLVYVKRETKTEKFYTQKMGKLSANVTYIKKYFMGLPVTTLHKYRNTYYGEVKSCKDCMLFI